MKEVKKKGSMLSMLPVLLGMMAICVLSLMYLSYMSDYEKKEAADQLARQYMLKMESEGYMSETSKQHFISAMSELGFSQVNLSGTTFADAGYGNTIMLIVNAVLTSDNYSVTDTLSITRSREDRRLYICKRSTAKN